MSSNSLTIGITGQTASFSKAKYSRIEWLDVAKGVGIILVVCGHALGGIIDSDMIQSQVFIRNLFTLIYFFHMPLFFMMSGLLVQSRLNKNPGRFHKSLVTQIAYPYFLWSIIQFTIVYLAGGLVNSPVDTYWSSILSLPFHTVSQYWFFYALFMLHAAAALILPRLGAVAFLLIMLMLKSITLIIAIASPWQEIALMSAYYGIGVFLGVDGLKDLIIDRPVWCKLYLFPTLSCFSLAASYTALIRDLSLENFTHITSAAIAHLCWTFSGFAAALFTTAAIIGLASLMPAWISAGFAYLGKMSLPIFVLHVLFCAGLRILLTKFMGVQDSIIILSLAIPLGIVGPLIFREIACRLKLGKLLALS